MAFQDFENSDFLSNIGGHCPAYSSGGSSPVGGMVWGSNGKLWSWKISASPDMDTLKLWENGGSKLSTNYGNASMHRSSSSGDIVYLDGSFFWPYTYFSEHRLYLAVKRYYITTGDVTTTYTTILINDYAMGTSPYSYVDLMYYPPDDKMWLAVDVSDPWGASFTRGTYVYCLDSDGTLDHRAYADYEWKYKSKWANKIRVSANPNYAFIYYKDDSNHMIWARMSKSTTDGNLTTISSGVSAGGYAVRATLPYGVHAAQPCWKNALETVSWTGLSSSTWSSAFLIKKIDSSDNYYALFFDPGDTVGLWKLASNGTATMLDSVSTNYITQRGNVGYAPCLATTKWPTDPIGLGGDTRIYSFTIPDKDVT